MSNTTFLTVEGLKNFTAISKNTDVSLLDNFILIAEEMHIQPILGLALTTELINQIDLNEVSVANENLMNNFIIPASAWSTFFEASTFLNFRTEAKGIVKKSSENSQPIDMKEFSAYKQSIADKMSFYKNRLIDYLELNYKDFPSYRSDNTVKSTKSNSSGIFLG